MAQVLPFNGFYTGNDPKNSARECVNFIPVRHDSGSLSEYTLEATTGITIAGPKVFPSNPGDLVSPVFSWDSMPGVINNNVCGIFFGGFLISSNGDSYTVTELTAPALFDARVSVNKDKLLVVDKIGGQATLQSIYLYNGATDTASTIDISSQLGGNTRFVDTAYFGDRFLLMNQDVDVSLKGRVHYSEINDAENYDPLGYFSSISQSEDSKGIIVLNERLYLFTGSGYTVWLNTADVNLPFIEQKGSAGGLGLLGVTAKCKVGDVLYLVGYEESSIGFFAFNGSTYQRISSEYIDQDIAGESRANVFSFSDNGRSYIGFTLSKTYCLDIKTGEFHIRGSSDESWNVAGSIASTNGNNVFFGIKSILNTADSYYIPTGKEDVAIGTEFDSQVDRKLVTSPFNSDGVSNLVQELSFQTSIDYSSLSPITPPALSLSISSDFGSTYNSVKTNSFDEEGENTKLLRFMSIGFFSQAFVFKIETSNIYPHKILKMLTRLKKGFRQI